MRLEDYIGPDGSDTASNLMNIGRFYKLLAHEQISAESLHKTLLLAKSQYEEKN
jgi:hypothetical protein